MRRRNWTLALAILFVAQLVWYLIYTGRIVDALRANAEGLTRIYAEVQKGLSDPSPTAADETLFALQTIILESGVPLILTGPGDTVLAAANLPFQADLAMAADQDRVRAYAQRLDFRRPPLGDSTLALLHFGDPPEVRNLEWIPWLQALGFLLTAVLAVLAVRAQRRAEGERAWTAMARELAHQLGTPLSSLQGWLELLGLPEEERPEQVAEGRIAAEIRADVERLERISHRFELIGREPELHPVDLRQVLHDLRGYLEARIPRLAAGVELELEVPDDLPPIRGNEVLLTWAFENLVKNSLDALGGKGGRILVRARAVSGRELEVTVSDSGSGIPPEVASSLFEPGVTTKSGGWGVGLALTRRIVEGVHGGRIQVGTGPLTGATIEVRLPRDRPEGRVDGQ